jgi:hypothetical protein
MTSYGINMSMKILCIKKSIKKTDLVFFLCSTQQKITVQNYHMHVLYKFLSLEKITKISQ